MGLIVKKRGKGRPKGSKDKVPRTRTKAADVAQLRREVRRSLDANKKLTKQVEKLSADNARLARGYSDNPMQLVASQTASESKKLTPEELKSIAEGAVGEIPFSGTEDELLALQHRRTQVSRMMLRGATRATIAEHLEISVNSVEADVRAVRREWRMSVNQYNISEQIGESLTFYGEIRDLNLLEATDVTNKLTDRMRAAEVSLKAEDSKNSFLAKVGLYDVLDAEKREAFRAEATRELDADATEFHKVIAFIGAAASKGGTTVEQVVTDAEYSDITPIDE
jgi:hypothetical protein